MGLWPFRRKAKDAKPADGVRCVWERRSLFLFDAEFDKKKHLTPSPTLSPQRVCRHRRSRLQSGRRVGSGGDVGNGRVWVRFFEREVTVHATVQPASRGAPLTSPPFHSHTHSDGTTSTLALAGVCASGDAANEPLRACVWRVEPGGAGRPRFKVEF